MSFSFHKFFPKSVFMGYTSDFLVFLCLLPVLFVMGILCGYGIYRGRLLGEMHGTERPSLRLVGRCRVVTEEEFGRLKRQGWLEEL